MKGKGAMKTFLVHGKKDEEPSPLSPRTVQRLITKASKELDTKRSNNSRRTPYSSHRSSHSEDMCRGEQSGK